MYIPAMAVSASDGAYWTAPVSESTFDASPVNVSGETDVSDRIMNFSDAP